MSYRKALVILITLLFQGCSDQSYIIRHQAVGTATMVAVDGSIRSVLVNDKGRFCAEPPPDAIGTIAKAIAAKAAAKVPAKVTTAEASGEYNKTFESDIHDLFQRSQGVQVLRDGMYRLCEAFVNGAIDQQIYSQQMIDLISTLDFVVPMELCVKLSSEERQEGIGEPSESTATPVGTRPENAGAIEASKSTKKVATVTRYHRTPHDELIKNCFGVAINFAYNHNQAVVQREVANQEAQKALTLRAILNNKELK